MENVDDYVGVIRDDPLAGGVAVDGHWLDAVVEDEPVMHLTGDRFQVRLGGAGADDEIIRQRGDAAQVEGDDVFGFFFRGVVRAKAGELFRFDGAAPGKVDGGR